MLRMIARWYISRSIDEDVRLPNWLRRWIDRDDELKQFEMASRQLDSRLKSDAPGWIASQATGAVEEAVRPQTMVAVTTKSSRRERTIAWSLAASAIAAGAFFAIAWLQSAKLPLNEDRVEQSLPGAEKHLALTPSTDTMSAVDREWLITAWKRSRANLGRLKAHAEDLPRRVEVLKMPDASTVVEPAAVAGSTAGRALATLDRGMESERQQLTSDVRAAFSFFAYRLPESVARLVGWQAGQAQPASKS
jgi:hypothetical protein